MATHLLVVDALNLIRRIYAGQPGEEGPDKAEAALVASSQSLRRALRQCLPTHAVCVFDGAGPSWRHETLPEYKAGHSPMPEPLAATLDRYRLTFADLGVASLERDHFEADDVIATIALKAVGGGARVTVLSTDKVFLSLLPAGVQVRDHFKGEYAGPDDVVGRFGVRPEQLVDALALAGDHGNGIKGVPGVGPKSAAKLLGRFGSLDEVLARADEIGGKLGERLREHARSALECRRLIELRTDLEVGANLSELRYLPADAED